MKKNFFTPIMLIMWSLSLTAQQNEKALDYAGSITEGDLRDYLSVLASDALEGRETGQRGQKMAAAFIESHFSALGLKGPMDRRGEKGYLQKFPLYRAVPGDIYIQGGDKTFKNFDKIMYYGSYDSQGPQKRELVFVGNGNEALLKKMNLKGKVVLIYPDSPRAWQAPHDRALEQGAEMALVVNRESEEAFDEMVGGYMGHLQSGVLEMEKPEKGQTKDKGIFFISPATAAQLLGSTQEKIKKALKATNSGKVSAARKIKPATFSYQTELRIETVYTENVLGYLEGSDKKEELVVLTAHYDHIGKHDGQINNGADDDGSGTVAIMEIAEAFAQAKADGHGPRRSMLFMTVTGEEKGLLGSSYYADHPVFPLKNTVVDLNIDMIGRIDPEHEDQPDYVYLVGSDKLSSELHKISETVNKTYSNLELNYRYNDEDHPDRIYYRSDHWNFAKNGIPVIFYFNGIHADYHQPTDTIEKIDFGILKKRTDLVFYTAWELANREGRIQVDKK